MFTQVKTDTEIKHMRESGKILATVHQLLRNKVAPGVSTKQLADIARDELKRLGGKPSFLGYPGGSDSFPDVLCVSINEEVVHGIPRANRVIEEGDIVSMDFGVTYKGMITDSAISVIAGNAKKPSVTRLIKDTEASLLAGIDVVRDGVRVGDIGFAVQQSLERGGYGIVRDLVGHGVGHKLHEEPNIPNYGLQNTGPTLQAGMTIAIEPMATLGAHHVVMAEDGWTVVTADGSLAAHFEHSVLITDDGYEILTTLS
ncbi:MAG: type I methionyl aminopeptidase [Candidatus Saccharibacteria bacterium]|nr:type I methionyl aminopeptidase [Candidatus Saccharibacteria bacterium]